MTVAFMVTSAYSGTLRAFLISPVLPNPVDTLEELVESGLSWNMVQYFHPLEEALATSDNPAKRKIWEDKVLVPYDAWPYERLKGVYDGKTAMLEWKNFNSLLEAAFTLPNGQPLVHLSKTVNLSPGVWATWGYNKLNPWIERFVHRFDILMEGGIEKKIRKDNRWVDKSINTPARQII